jgi:hypothetical protein
MSDAPAEVMVPLDEWLADKSLTDRSVEMLAVFRFRERAGGRHHDLPSHYEERYVAARSQPVR